MDIHTSLPWKRRAIGAACVLAPAVLFGCKHTIEVAPIEVKPIHATLDINLKVDRQLDEFFDFEEPAPASQPASAPNSDSETSQTSQGGTQ